MSDNFKILNLGSGMENLHASGVTTLDFNASAKPDILHDLNMHPWPLPDNSFDVILCRDVIEHVADIKCFMEEVHRIGKKGGKIQITTPHFSCANSYTDPTHQHHLGLFSFDYFTGENQWSYYSHVRFKKVRRILYFYPGIFRRPIAWLANHYPELYEKKFTWIFPAWFLDFEFEILK